MIMFRTSVSLCFGNRHYYILSGYVQTIEMFVCSVWQFAIFCSVFMVSWVSGYGNAGPTAEEIAAFKSKWGADEILRDNDHLNEDLAQMIDLSERGVITTEETYFYFFRMHDFDENHSLDGLEMYAAIQHSAEHRNMSMSMGHEIVTTTVDVFLRMDSNNNGFLSYDEFRANLDMINSAS